MTKQFSSLGFKFHLLAKNYFTKVKTEQMKAQITRAN